MKTTFKKRMRQYFSDKSKSFIYKFAFFFFFCNMILIFGASAIFYKNTVQIILDSSYQYTYTIMEQARYNFDTYMTSHRAILNSIAENDILISASQCYERGDIDNTIKYETRIVDTIKSSRENHPDIHDIVIVMDNGLLVNRESGWGMNMEYPFPETEWYQNALRYDRNSPTNIFYMQTDFYKPYSSNQGESVVVISQPVYNYLQQKVGAVFYLISLDGFWTSVLNGYHSQYGDLVLTNQENKIIAHSKRGDEGQNFPHIEDAILIKDDTEPIKGNPAEPILLLLPSKTSACNVLCSINIDINKETSLLLQCIVLIVILFVAVNLFITLYISRNLNRPIHSLVTDMKGLAAADQKLLNGNYRYTELLFIANNFNLLLKDIKDLNDRQTEMQITLQKAKNQILISKINPHFLFNSLQLIQTENLYGSKEKTNSIILSLSNQLRYNIYDDSDDMVPLCRELERVSEYLHLCSEIFENNLDIKIDIPDSLMPCCIPKFTLHTLAENSIKHGFHGTPENGLIHISGKDLGAMMELSVEDNGTGISKERLAQIRSSLKNGTHPGIGLLNLTKQMEYFYGDNYRIDIQSNKAATCVTVRFPADRTNVN
ncbi:MULTISPECIES: cache domain-containing sensor histidine kinase [Blautia]|uniref:cache domain-containing sensor histidine kinase n=1 Tax=Blautia TaxID=572511 RepID=UPI0011CBE0F3|nr:MULTISPECIES: histidine kinase [Blautia]